MAQLYPDLESALVDPQFAPADVLLRQGGHISADDVELYAFLQAVEGHLSSFYKAFGCRLIHGPEGYYFLLSEGDLLGQSRLRGQDMLVGSVLALMAMDPRHLASGGAIERGALLKQMEMLLGPDQLAAQLMRRPRGRPIRDRSGEEDKVRDAVQSALLELHRLGFVHYDRSGERIRPRPAIHRFVEPMRQSQDLGERLRKLEEDGTLERERAEDDIEAGEDEGE